ncbi:hypothetical protein [Mesorhizobium sp. ORS 3428]|uniref:hypothetical protein n=1 Tax=Mesorhizobium sp. ORS 3428 TaxID=540997 RepID=UPI0008D92BF9|nr:hypothetical protein [Mesorhizobium sp. ORS 3428]OHV86214.1 hypothetical protein ORS3428_25095 [Mesorhizobium sp. ORS 3428]
MYELANTPAEFDALGEAAANHDYITDKRRWEAARSAKIGVLAKLSEEALRQFDASALFWRGCLISAHFEKVELELTADELASFWALFGLGAGVLAYASGYVCAGRCKPLRTHYCYFNGKKGSEGYASGEGRLARAWHGSEAALLRSSLRA